MSPIPIFNGVAPVTQVTTFSTVTQIYNTTSGGPYGSTIVGPLTAITIVNTGANTCFVGQSTVTATTGVPVGPGQQLTISGGNAQTLLSAGATSWNLYGITASGTTTTEVSLATLVTVL